MQSEQLLIDYLLPDQELEMIDRVIEWQY